MFWSLVRLLVHTYSTEASVTFIGVGLVRSITRTLHFLDLDHSDSPKVAYGTVKILEVVTKEHVLAAENNIMKGESVTKPPDQSVKGRTDNSSDTSQAMETTLQPSLAYVSTCKLIDTLGCSANR
ncbi:hypothetical protein POM88_048150 [Heracleum sosnowskyi]|uniref:Uncharacterized protein n=1 Tax=Heracleum sosnowskyi TaxID=360622 RepID=A0AAD8GUT1_9APIA|nr:hypothetical protein POM88_048150 [Heracleum sosnowskyi]